MSTLALSEYRDAFTLQLRVLIESIPPAKEQSFHKMTPLVISVLHKVHEVRGHFPKGLDVLEYKQAVDFLKGKISHLTVFIESL